MKFTRAMSVVAVFAFVSPLLALGDPFVYTDHWPSGTGDETATEVSIPDGTTATISTADDVTRVARLTTISLDGSAAKVDYTASDALALSASVSGSGKFSAISSGTLTLSGDNSGLVSPGCFFFSNMAVTVASRYGLGSTNTAQLVYWFGGKVDPLHFSGAGLTNDAPIRVHQGTASKNFVLGPDNADETLVIANRFTFDGDYNDGAKTIYFRNNVRIRAGVFGADSLHIWAGVSGLSAEVWFEEDVTVNFLYWFLNSSNLRIHLDWSGVTGSKEWIVPYSPVVAVCEKSGLFGSFTYGITGSGTIDLNGHDQMVKCLGKTYGSGTMKFTSARPATFSVTGYDAGANNKTSSAKFSGAVNFTYAPATASGAYTLTGSDALSDSTGKLTVGGAGHLIFANNSGWSGTNVVVKSGATLELNSEKAMTNTTAKLTVETGGSLVLHSGAACMAKTVTIAGATLDAGATYTVAQLKKMGLPVEGDDLATISVSEDSSAEWHGWPTTPGAVADVPAGVTVYVSDDDVATLEALGGIRLRTGAAVICTNLTEQLDLSATVYGVGSFKVLDSEKIVLSGDNSGLVSPGCFFFSNTAVTVASRYGLGSAGSAKLHYWFGSKKDPLHFTGAGLTNDAPIRIHQGTANYNFVLGPDNAGETLVIRNDLLFDGWNGSGSLDPVIVLFRNNVRIRGGEFGADSKHIASGVYGDSAEVWFEDDARVKFYLWFSSGSNLRCHLGWSGLTGNKWLFVLWNSLTYAVCERSNVFSTMSGGVGGYGTFDLNGFDQSVTGMTRQYGGTATFTSATSATFTVGRTGNTSDAYYTSSSFRFSGKVNFTCNLSAVSDAYTLTGSGALSDSSGMLTVKKGILTFAEGAGWCGTNVLVKAGAKLSVGAASMPVAFGSRAVLGHQSWTKLEIESGGTLELAASAEPAVVRTLVYNGQMMPAGTYTSSSGVGITGGGSLRVRSSTDGEPGAMVIIY